MTLSGATTTAVQADAGVDPVELVNPFIGTGSGGQFVGSVNAFRGAVAPFGMLSSRDLVETVTVVNAKSAERQNEQTDFRIASDQPVTIHSVRTTITDDGVFPMDLCS